MPVVPAPVPYPAPYAALADVNEDQVSPGLLGFLIVVVLGIALFFLVRSMNQRISRIQAPKEEDLKQAEWERRQATQDSGDAGNTNDTEGTGKAIGDNDGQRD